MTFEDVVVAEELSYVVWPWETHDRSIGRRKIGGDV